MKNNNNNNQKMGFLTADLVKPKVYTADDVPYMSEEKLAHLMSDPTFMEDIKDFENADESSFLTLEQILCDIK